MPLIGAPIREVRVRCRVRFTHQRYFEVHQRLKLAILWFVWSMFGAWNAPYGVWGVCLGLWAFIQ